MKLLCDHMLGSLAKWLRIFGLDTVYPDATINDDDVLKIAKHDDRLLISRDKELIRRGKKALVNVLEIQTTDLTEQLRQVLLKIKIDTEQVLTRCTLCNTPLVSVEKKQSRVLSPKRCLNSEMISGSALCVTNIIGWGRTMRT